MRERFGKPSQRGGFIVASKILADVGAHGLPAELLNREEAAAPADHVVHARPFRGSDNNRAQQPIAFDLLRQFVEIPIVRARRKLGIQADRTDGDFDFHGLSAEQVEQSAECCFRNGCTARGAHQRYTK